jgi:hypothetical protein
MGDFRRQLQATTCFPLRIGNSLFAFTLSPYYSSFPSSYYHAYRRPPPPALPDAQPTVHDLARQVAANLATFSNAYPFTPIRVAKTALFLAAGTPLHMKRAILTDVSATIQWMLISHHQVVVVTRPVVATNAAGDPIFLASLGDNLAQAIPVSLLDSATLGSVVVLVTQDRYPGRPHCFGPSWLRRGAWPARPAPQCRRHFVG